MPHDVVTIANFQKGLATKGSEDFGEPDAFRTAQNVRFKTGSAKRRAGTAKVATAGTDNVAQNFDGTNDVVTVPRNGASAWTSVWNLPLRWSLRLLVSCDDTPAGDEFILGWSSTGNKGLTVKIDSSRRIVVDHWDSAGTNVTLTGTAITAATATPIMVTRSTSTLKLWIENTVAASSTSLSSTLLGRTTVDNLTFGAHNGANFFDGTIDYCDLQHGVVLADNADGFLRLTDTYADPVEACYFFAKSANNHVDDLSRNGNTGLLSGASDATALCVQASPVLLMHQWQKANGTRPILLNAGGRIAPCTVA